MGLFGFDIEKGIRSGVDYVMGPEAQEEEAMGPPLAGKGGLMPGDPTEKMAAKDGQNLAFTIWHIPSGKNVRFKALIKDFSDKFESQWSSEDVYGRMDPIQTFQGTRRVITISWDVVAFDLVEAKKNLGKMDKLANFLYPVYGDVGGKHGDATSILAAPLLRIKFANLIRQPGLSGAGTGDAPKGGGEDGLVVRMDGFSYTPDFDSGVHLDGKENVKLYPQTIHVQGTFHVFHTHPLGWGKDKKPRKGGFPHGEWFEEGSPKEKAAKKAKKSDKKETPAIAASRETKVLEGADSESERSAIRSGLPSYAFVG